MPNTRDKLLAAALDEFVEKGFAGARVDTVALQAKVNKRMIYHYFGSKRGIWEAIFDESFWADLSAEQKIRLELWQLLASRREPVTMQYDVESRAREIGEMQSQGLIRSDVDPVCVAAAEWLIQHASGLWVADVIKLSNPVEQLTEMLSRLLRPRIRVKPRVVSL